MERFTITDEHLKLLRRMNVGWDGGEFGAPSIDCKRPYGNSDVYGDIAEIIGIPVPNIEEDEEWVYEAIKRMDALHQQMKTVLQIVVRAGEIGVGDYESDEYRGNWRGPLPGNVKI